jgi:hypothetical protein
MKAAFLGACFVALFAAAGCGSSSSQDSASDGAAPTTSVKTPTNTVDPPRAEIRTSWMLLYDEGGTDSAPPPDELYAVFARKQTDDEAKIAPEVVADSSCSMPLAQKSKHTDFGKPIEEKARILLRGVGSGDDSLVAVPTTADSVAIAVFPNGGGSCTRPSDNGLIVGADGNGDTTNVYGMVDDRVRSVDVIADGQTHRAKLGENGFSVALPSGAEEHLDKLVLHRADGSKAEFPLG